MKKLLLSALVLFLVVTICPSLQGDQIHLKDGRVIEGKIIDEEGGQVRIMAKWGELRYDKSQIKKVVKKRSTSEEYQHRFDKLAYNDAEGFYQLGLFAKENNMKKEMECCYKKALSINPYHKGAREALGYVFHQGRWILKKDLEASQQKTSSSSSTKQEEVDNFTPPKGTSKLALEYLKKGDEFFEEAKRDIDNTREKLEKAIFYFKAAANLAYKFSVPHYKLGILYQWTRKFLPAKRSLERAISLNPKFHEALAELGDTYSWMTQYEKALEMYNKSIALYPKYYMVYRSRGLLFCKMRKFPEARDDFKKAISLKADPYSMQVLALVEKELGGLPWQKTYTVKSAHYVVYTNSSEEYAKTISAHAEHIYKVYSKIFPKKKMRKDLFPIYVFNTRKEYVQAGSPGRSAGYFHPILQKLVFYKQPDLDNTLTVLYHEGFHQYVHYYAPYIPSWFNEGNGDFFGGCRQEGIIMAIKPNKWRLGMIKQSIKGKTYVDLSKLMQMSKAQMYSGNKSLHYAQAWAMVYFFWMYNGGQYRPYLKNYFKLIREGYGGVEAYKKVWSKLDMKKVEQEWTAYVVKLK